MNNDLEKMTDNELIKEYGDSLLASIFIDARIKRSADARTELEKRFAELRAEIGMYQAEDYNRQIGGCGCD
jgi:hypothetical protein